MIRLLSILVAVSFSLGIQAQRFVKTVGTLTDLRALNTADVTGTNVFINGTSTNNDGGQAIWSWTPNDATTPSASIVTSTSGGVGRWRLQFPNSGTTSGTGVVNRVTKWSGTSTLTTGQMTFSATNTLADGNLSIPVGASYQMGGTNILAEVASDNAFVVLGGNPAITTGYQNSTWGVGAGARLTSGFANTLGGYHAGNSLTTNVTVVAIGMTAAETANASFLTAIGTASFKSGTLTGDEDTGVGYHTGILTTSGTLDFFGGSHSGANNTTGSRDTFTGAYSGYLNTIGNNNTATGEEASENNISGNDNVSDGYRAGKAMTTDGNVSVGAFANENNSGGVAVVAIGRGANRAATSGVGVIALGFASSEFQTGGNDRFTVGVNSGDSAPLSLSNTIIMGAVSHEFTNIFFSGGMYSATPLPWVANGTGGSGTNISGGGVIIAGGKGTGNAVGGSVALQSSVAGASGTNVQSLGTQLLIDPTGVNYPNLTASLPLALNSSKYAVSRAIVLSSGDVSGYLPVANGGNVSGTVINSGASTTNKIPAYTDTTGTNVGPVSFIAGSNMAITKGATGFTFDASGGGSGTVTSVALTVPTGFSVAGSPVTTNGTLAISESTQTANLLKAGPASGGAATPTYRTMVGADIPNALIVATTKLSATGTPSSSTFLRGDDTWAIPSGGSGTFFANPSGTIGLTPVNGTDTNALRADGRHALSQAIIPTWTGLHSFINTTTNQVAISYDVTQQTWLSTDASGNFNIWPVGQEVNVAGVVDAQLGFKVNNAAASGNFLRGNGTIFVSSALAATDISSGTIATARLGSGTANATTFLSGDQTYKTAVTSVALAVPAEFSVSGSPILTNGTITISKATQTANTVYAGPSSGSAAQPAFRTLVNADIPAGTVFLTPPVTSLNTSSATTTTLFTVPSGKIFVILGVDFYATAVTGADANRDFTFYLEDGDATIVTVNKQVIHPTVINSAKHADMGNSTDWTIPIFADDVCKLTILTPATDGCTMTVRVRGYYMN